MQRSSIHVRAMLAMSALLAVSASADVTPSHHSQVAAGGTFTDKTGAKHVWSITGSHALVWDNQPYLPVGGCFYPASLSSDQPQSWDRDTATLKELKSRGISDVLVVPDVSLPDTSPARMQRLVDFLDSNDFRYGVSFGKGIPDPLVGTVVKPASYKGYPDVSLTASWQTPNADSALLILAETTTGHNEVAKHTLVKMTDNNLTVSVEAPATVGKVVPYLYPHKSVPSGTRGSIPDIWSGYDTYRDRLLTYFSVVKPGKGFRFFLDPLGAQLSLSDETDYLVPDSKAFLLEWESYIRTTYPNVEDAYHSWGLEEASALTPKELARLIPLWANDVSIPYMYDPTTKKTLRLADALQCHWWLDFLACRNKGVQYYMNSLANVLKHQVADVPVVYNWTMNHPIFINSEKSGGFDGLGISANLRGTRLVNRIAVPAYSEVEQCSRRIWYIEASAGPEIDADPTVPDTSSPGIPFGSQGVVTQEVTDLRRTGLKGFFPGSFRNDTANNGRNDWLRTPNALDWLREAGTSVAADSHAAEFAPTVLPYPIGNPGPAMIGPIGNTGALWIPTFEQGRTHDWWPAFSGYTIDVSSDQNPETVVVSLHGKHDGNFFVDRDAKLVSARSVTGVPIPVKVLKKGLFSISFPDKNPVIISSGGQQMDPIEAADDAITQLELLFKYASSIKSEGLEAAKVAREEARMEYLKHVYPAANVAARNGIDRLLADTAPYVWIEGEMFDGITTFDDAPLLPGASKDRYLRVSNYNNPPREYAVHYPINIVAKGRYNIWMAATAPAADVSPFQWAIADNQRRDPADPNPHGALYANDKFGWILLGTANFDRPGSNKLAIYVTGRAPANGRYSFGIDAIFLTTASDPPYGRVMPEPMETGSLTHAKDNKH